MREKKRILALVLALAVCAGGGLFLWRSGFFSLDSVEQLQGFIQKSAPYSHLVFFLVQFLSVVLAPIPSNISAAAGGALFGVWPAFFLTFSAVMAGSLLVFQLARVLGRDFADRIVSRKLSEKYREVIRVKTGVFLALAFLFPFFPDDALCILAGLTGISFRRFALIVLLARPWGLLFASALGGAAFTVPLGGMVLIGLAGAALFVLGMKYGNKAEQAVLNRFRRKNN